MMENPLKKIKIKNFLLNLKSRGVYILPLILFSACGIAVYYYLNPPTVPIPNLTFYHAYNNDPNYAVGYDYFYRIYDGDSTTESDIIEEAKSFFTENNLLEILFSNRNLISNNYYKRILPISDNLVTDYELTLGPIPTADVPIMKIDPLYFAPNKTFSITIEILTGGTGKISCAGYTPAGSYKEEIYFERYITIDNSSFERKDFSDIEISHDDIPFTSIPSTIDIAFFVVLYGKNENFVPIFSDVVYIGSVNDF